MTDEQVIRHWCELLGWGKLSNPPRIHQHYPPYGDYVGRSINDLSEAVRVWINDGAVVSPPWSELSEVWMKNGSLAFLHAALDATNERCADA